MFTGIIRDISERKQLEREIVEIAMLEQRRLGADLHDECGQELTARGLLADSLVHSLQECARARLSPAAGRDGIKRVLQYLRDIARGLSTVEVDPAHLATALEELAADPPRPRPSPGPFHGGDRGDHGQPRCHPPLPHRARACTKALSMLGARKIQVRLGTRRGVVTLRIEDDGIGIPDDVREGIRPAHHAAIVPA